MYSIEKKDYGVHLTFGGVIQEAEMAAWVSESEKIAPSLPAQFGVFVDMRTLKPLNEAAQATMHKGQVLYKSKGMVRSVVILASSVLTLQFKRIAKESGIDQWERYLDASTVKNWEEVGVKWLVSGVDPGKL